MNPRDVAASKLQGDFFLALLNPTSDLQNKDLFFTWMFKYSNRWNHPIISTALLG